MIHREKPESIYKKYSKVSGGDHKKYRRLTYTIFSSVIAVLFFIALLLTGHSAKTTTKSVPINDDHPLNFHHELDENIAKLASLESSQSLLSPLNLSKTKNAHHSRAYFVRQNAPTRMFTQHSILQTMSQNTKAASHLFWDKNPIAHFLNRNSSVSRVRATKIANPEMTIPQGELIHAVLESAINSDLPGMLRAVVSRSVYSYTADQVLIPKGSRLIGQYLSMTTHGINRVMVIWNRILLPNGISVQVDSPGVDTLGRSGLKANDVDAHFVSRFGRAVLLSLISAGASTIGVNNDDQYNATQKYRMAISQSFQRSASRSLKDAESIKPTLSIHQGALINVFVSRDLDMSIERSLL